MQDAVIGKTLDGKYQVEKLLGRGGMGDVYRAEHLQLQRPVAVKLLRALLLEDSQGKEPLRRFEREAKTACKIDHPNAVSVFDYGVVDGQPYIVMSLVQGVTLKQHLQSEKAIPLEEKLSILGQVASAITQAHALGIVHRDLKPDNIMLERQADGKLRAQVLDFGLAKLVGDSVSGASLTNSGDTLGTPLYMSPEQVQGSATTTASDVYSFGIIAYELLAGDVPFRAEQAMSVMFKHLHEPPPSLRTINPEFPHLPELEAVFQKVLAKQAEHRFSSVSECFEALSCALQGTQYIPPAAPSKRKVKSYAAPAIAAALALSVLAAFYAGKETQQVEDLPHMRVQKTQTTDTVGHPALTANQIAARIQEAEQLLRKNKVPIAHTILLQIIVQAPNNAQVHYLLSKTHYRMRRPVKAYEHLHQAQQLEPDNPAYQSAMQEAKRRHPEIVTRLQEIKKGRDNRQP